MINEQENKLSLIEDLFTELFVQISSYLNGIDALLAFSNPNYRFKTLIGKYCKVFNFKSK
ncbi:unnamed protein product, partial [Rotaria sordida]